MFIAWDRVEGLLVGNFDGLRSTLFGSTLPFGCVRARGPCKNTLLSDHKLVVLSECGRGMQNDTSPAVSVETPVSREN
jgi:hypothetical protein